MGIKYKKTSILLILIVLFGILTSCDPNPYEGKRPIDYENSIWRSDNPVVNIEYGQSSVIVTAYLIENQEMINIDVSYGLYDNSVLFLDLEGNILLEFSAEFSSDHCILTITNHVTDIFLTQSKITLYRSQS